MCNWKIKKLNLNSNNLNLKKTYLAQIKKPDRGMQCLITASYQALAFLLASIKIKRFKDSLASLKYSQMLYWNVKQNFNHFSFLHVGEIAYYWMINTCPFMHNFKKLNHFWHNIVSKEEIWRGGFQKPLQKCSALHRTISNFSCSDSVTGCHYTNTNFIKAHSLTVYTAMHSYCKRILFYTDEAKQFFTGWHTKQGKFSNNTGPWHLLLMWLLCLVTKSYVLGFLRPLF